MAKKKRVRFELDEAEAPSIGPSFLQDLFFPKDMKDEVYFKMSTKAFIIRCITSKAELQRCMTPGHLVNYMRNKNPSLTIKDAYFILKFASQYLTTHPKLWVQTSDAFLEIFVREIKLLNELDVRPRGKAKGKMCKGKAKVKTKSDKREPTDEEYDMIAELSDIVTLAADCITTLAFLEFDEDTYGKIENLRSSNMFKLYMKIAIFRDVLTGRDKLKLPEGYTVESHVFMEFLMDFAENIRITDRGLDVKFLDFVFPTIEGEEWAEESEIQNAWGRYIDNNTNSDDLKESMIAMFAERIVDINERREYLDTRDVY